jgi:hypothetical protein
MKHDEISPEQKAMMNAIAKTIDTALNGTGPKHIGFALLTYRFNEDITGTGRINYIGNGQRENVLVALKELVARWEGRYAEPEGKQ